MTLGMPHDWWDSQWTQVCGLPQILRSSTCHTHSQTWLRSPHQLPSPCRVTLGDHWSVRQPSLVPGFWWGWPAGAWTARTPPTPVSSPGLPTLPAGLTKSRASTLPLALTPPLPRPSPHTSLGRLLAPPGPAQTPCCHIPGSGSRRCSCSGDHQVTLLLLSASGPWPLTGTFHTTPLPAHWLSVALLLGFPVHQLPPLKQAQENKTKPNKTLTLLLSWGLLHSSALAQSLAGCHMPPGQAHRACQGHPSGTRAGQAAKATSQENRCPLTDAASAVGSTQAFRRHAAGSLNACNFLSHSVGAGSPR